MTAFAGRLFSEHPEVEEIVVFGSFEKGTYAPGSDLEVLLVLTDSPRPIRERLALYLPDGFPVPMDLFPFTRAELEARDPSPVIEAARRSRWRYRRPVEASNPPRA